MTIAEDEQILPLCTIESTHSLLAILTKNGRLLIVPLAELRTLSAGGKGTKLIDLDDGDHIQQWVTGTDKGFVLSGVYRRRYTDWMISDATLANYIGKRARKGKVVERKIIDAVLTAYKESTE